MKVRFKAGWRGTFATLTPGNVYRVIGIEADTYRIIDDTGEPFLFAPAAFHTVDATEPADWISERGVDGERYAYPVALHTRGFFERWHDRDPNVRSKFSAYMNKLCWSEVESGRDAANVYIRVHWKHSLADEPVMLYSELDEDRLEVRKVEVFSDGRMCYADGKFSSGDTRLGEVPVPSIDEIAADSQFEPVVISREEFETVWDRAYAADVD